MGAVAWKNEPDDHDYPAAASYLSLIAPPSEVDALVKALQGAPLVHQKAKDILRASTLPLLPVDNPHVASDLAKVNKNKALSPVLLVRGDLSRGLPAQIADGYHRVCASYHTDENHRHPVPTGRAAVDVNHGPIPDHATIRSGQASNGPSRGAGWSPR